MTNRTRHRMHQGRPIGRPGPGAPVRLRPGDRMSVAAPTTTQTFLNQDTTSVHAHKPETVMNTLGAVQASSFSSALAPGCDEAGFWPVTSRPSVTTKGFQFSTFS